MDDDEGSEIQELVRAMWTSKLGQVAGSKKPIESWRAFFLSPASLNWQCLPFLTRRRGPEEASFFLKGLVFGLWNDVGPAGELANKQAPPARRWPVKRRPHAKPLLCQNQGTHLWRCDVKKCPSASDSRLGRPKASHIYSGLSCTVVYSSLQLRGPHNLPSSTRPHLEATSKPAHVRCGHTC